MSVKALYICFSGDLLLPHRRVVNKNIIYVIVCIHAESFPPLFSYLGHLQQAERTVNSTLQWSSIWMQAINCLCTLEPVIYPEGYCGLSRFETTIAKGELEPFISKLVRTTLW